MERWIRNWHIRMRRIDQGLYETKNSRARSKWKDRSKHHADWLKGLRLMHEIAVAAEQAAEDKRIADLAEQIDERDGVQRAGVH